MEPSFAWPTYPDLAGKVAVVTGGSGALGGATCRALGANGVRVAVNGRDIAAIDSVVRDVVEAGGQAMAAPGDCTDATALGAMRDRVVERFGAIDVLVAFAGGGRPPQPVAEIGEAAWREDVDRNLTSTFLTLTSFVPGMVERRTGSIITMASVAARVPGGAPIAYAAAKAGVVAFTQHVAKEVGPSCVRVNCLAPSTVLNERMRAQMPDERRHQLAATFPLGRLGAPTDVAQAALFFASDASSWITGVTLDIAGGQVMR
jgi:3-oxoacyl-[acyl-carrier protein] reductase